MSDFLGSALRLHRFMLDTMWDGARLRGPDPGIRFNARVGRFVKSYTPRVAWNDDLVYLQAQAYWIRANWLVHDLTGEERHATAARACADAVLSLQTPEGFWHYPNPEWRGRVATVEGCFAALGLIDTFERTGDVDLLHGALRWHGYMEDQIGYRDQGTPGRLAVNYFAGTPGAMGGVPNNSTLVLWMLARLAEVTGDRTYLEPATALTDWLAQVQLPSGELPYALGEHPDRDRTHFLCYQYNAFEFMDLANYKAITSDGRVDTILRPLARYLEQGLTPSGAPMYECGKPRPTVVYYGSAIASALSRAEDLGLIPDRGTSALGHRWVLEQQAPSGAFLYHSRGNYLIASDRRHYPRYLAMILYLLLAEHQRIAISGA